MPNFTEYPPPAPDLANQPWAAADEPDHIAHWPDPLTSEERKHIAELQSEFLRLAEINARFAPERIHQHLDTLREKLILDPGNGQYAAQLVAERAGFHQMKMTSKEACRRFTVGSCVQPCLEILRRCPDELQYVIERIDENFQSHWSACGQCGDGQQSPIAGSFRNLQRDIRDRITRLEAIKANDYFMTSPKKMLAGVLRWLPTAEPKEITE
jgi:hypothetical protein